MMLSQLLCVSVSSTTRLEAHCTDGWHDDCKLARASNGLDEHDQVSTTVVVPTTQVATNKLARLVGWLVSKNILQRTRVQRCVHVLYCNTWLATPSSQTTLVSIHSDHNLYQSDRVVWEGKCLKGNRRYISATPSIGHIRAQPVSIDVLTSPPTR